MSNLARTLSLLTVEDFPIRALFSIDVDLGRGWLAGRRPLPRGSRVQGDAWPNSGGKSPSKQVLKSRLLKLMFET